MSTYSERDEEDFILKFFGDQARGFFVDIGAFDGIRLSNTRALALRGWAGVLVEPNPLTYTRLVENSHNALCACVEAAITEIDSLNRLYIDEGEAARCSLHDGMTKQFVRFGGNMRVVPTMTCAELVEQYDVPRTFDFLAVDAEGEDKSILRHWPFTLAAPRLIMAEVMHDPLAVGKMSYLLAGRNYGMAWSNGYNAAWKQLGEPAR